jgi:hypothetical protein
VPLPPKTMLFWWCYGGLAHLFRPTLALWKVE